MSAQIYLHPSAMREFPLPSPPAIATAPRVYRRPSPPPSQQTRQQTRQPQPETAPPIQHPPLEVNGPPRWPLRLALIVAATAAATLAGVLVGVLVMRGDTDRGEIANAEATEVGQLETAVETDSPIEVASATWQSPSTWQDLLGESTFDDAENSPTGAQLLASRFYELETDDQGRIIAARMPADSHGRFGPTLDEIAALSQLPYLQRLDLRDTIATAAVPIANRQANLKVLVLENQSNAGGLDRLSGIEELHLVNSPLDDQLLVERGIKIVSVSSP